MPASPAHAGPRDTLVAVSLLLVCALAVALMPPLARYGFADGVNVATFIAIRAVFSVAILGGLLLAAGRPFRIPRPLFGLAAFASATGAGMNYAFLESIRHIDIGLAILVMFLHPFFIAIYYHLRRTSRLTAARFAFALMAFAGLGLALAVDFHGLDRFGLLMAFAAAVGATAMVIAMIKVNEHAGGMTTNLHMALWTVAIFAVVLAVTGDVQWPRSIVGWTAAAGTGVAHVTAFLLFLVAVRLIGGSRASLFSFAEPVATIVLAALLFDERMSLLQWFGVALVMAGLVLMEVRFGRRA